MNVAILLTNSVRINHDVRENIKDFLSDLDNTINVDFFCTTWFNNELNFNDINNLFDFKILDIECQNDYSNSFILNYDNYKNFCNSYTNENPLYKLYSEPNFQAGGGINSLYTVYKIYRGYKLIENYSKKNNIKYDVVIRTRFDLEFLSKISIDQLIEAKNNDSFFGRNMKKEMDLSRDFFFYTDNWICDDYFYANFETFKKIADLYFQYYEYSIKHNTWITHIWFKEYINDNNIKFTKSSIIGRLRRLGGVYNLTPFYYS